MKLTEAPRATASVRRVVRAAMVVWVLARGAIMKFGMKLGMKFGLPGSMTDGFTASKPGEAVI
jgi:hypothetical protein